MVRRWAPGALILLATALVQQLMPVLAAEEFVQSRPVRMNDAEFSVATPDQLVAGKPAELELRIKNLTQKKLIFPVFDSIKLELNDSKGMPIGVSGARRASKPLPAMSVGPGECKSVIMNASVAKDADGVRLTVEDGTGFAFVSRVLKPGAIRLNLSYTSKPRTKSGSADAQSWVGEAATEDIEIKLSDGSAPAPPAVLPGSGDDASLQQLPGLP